MTTRYGRDLLAMAVASMAGFLLACSAASAGEAAKRPNIVMILADDKY